MVYRAKDFRDVIRTTALAERIETEMMLRVLDYIKVFENGELLVHHCINN